MFRFGSKLLLSGLLHTLYTNLYSLVIGKRYNALEVGYYNQSNQIARFPSVSLMAVITRALYPIQCRNQDNQDLLGASFLRYIKFSSLIVFSIMIMIASLSVPLVNILLTNKWNSISGLISILCVGYMFTPITVLNNQILNVKGRSDLFLKVEILKKIAGIIILIASIPFGLDIICLGILAYNIIDMLLVMCFARKIHNISPLNQIISVLPIFIATVGSGITCFLITCLISSYVIQLLLGLIVFISTLLILSKILRISEISFVINMIRTILQSQK